MSELTGELRAGAAHALDVSGSPTRLLWQRFLRHHLAVASLIVLVILALAALTAPLVEAWTSLSPTRVELMTRHLPPSWAHPLGTDELGRDVFLRLLHGGRISLTVGLTAAAISAVIGTSIGLVAGYYGGRFDALLMRVTDGVIALPLLPLLIVLAAIDYTKLGIPDSVMTGESTSLYRIIFLVAIVGWTTVARLVRGAVLSLKTRDYVLAAQALGASNTRVMTVHLLPNVASPIIVATTLSIGNIILLESVLSFLGLGIQPPMASWGNMLTNAQELIYANPLLAVWPGVLIFLTVIAFNFIGDGLQDALDPRSGLHR